MQIAGSTCYVCNKHIGSLRVGTGCLTCRISVHKLCASDELCPKCQRPLARAALVHNELSESARQDRDRPKGVTVLSRLSWMGLPLGALVMLSGLAGLHESHEMNLEAMLTGLVVMPVSVAVAAALKTGARWVRQFILYATPLVWTIEFVFLEARPSASLLPWQFTAALDAIVYLAFVYVLMRPAAVAFFTPRKAATQ